jgi:hypothetical protein
VDGSPYGGNAYCEIFPRDYDPNATDNDPSWPVYLAQVGKQVLTTFMTATINSNNICDGYVYHVEWQAGPEGMAEVHMCSGGAPASEQTGRAK